MIQCDIAADISMLRNISPNKQYNRCNAIPVSCLVFQSIDFVRLWKNSYDLDLDWGWGSEQGLGVGLGLKLRQRYGVGLSIRLTTVVVLVLRVALEGDRSAGDTKLSHIRILYSKTSHSTDSFCNFSITLIWWNISFRDR